MRNITYTFKKDKFNLFLILFGILLYNPFIAFYSISIVFKLFFVIILSFYLLGQSDLKNSKKSFSIFLFSFTIIIFYFLYYTFVGIVRINSLIVQLISCVFMLSLYLYFRVGSRIEMASNVFVKIIILISIITIIAFFGSNTGIIPFPKRNIVGYDVGFNYILGAVSFKYLLYQPSFYFAEPSYIGFFLGFSFFFLKQLVGIKRKKIKLLIILIAGFLVLSTTFYITMGVVLIFEIIYKILKGFININIISKVIIILFLIFSTTYISKHDVIADYLIPISTSFNNREDRIEMSISTIKHMNFNEFLLGKGTGYISEIDTNRIMGESNSYLRTLVENGFIILLIYIFVIYTLLKTSPSILLYTLVSLHSVIVLETPFLLFIILLASAIDNRNVFIKQGHQTVKNNQSNLFN